MSMKPTNTVFLAHGNDGHLVELNVGPLAFDGHLVKLRVAGLAYLTQCARLEDLQRAEINNPYTTAQR
jgi:hypothetical protein